MRSSYGRGPSPIDALGPSYFQSDSNFGAAMLLSRHPPITDIEPWEDRLGAGSPHDLSPPRLFGPCCSRLWGLSALSARPFRPFPGRSQIVCNRG
jgi:hypothetical protein